MNPVADGGLARGVLGGLPDDKKLDGIGDMVARLDERMQNNSRRLDEVIAVLSEIDGKYAGRGEFASNRRMIVVSMVFSIMAFGLSVINTTAITAVVLAQIVGN